jgi:hypothetical protein
MDASFWSALVLVALALVTLAPRWRLRRALARPFAPEWRRILEANVGAYPGMDGALQAQVHKLVQQFLHQKKFVGCAGLEIDDTIRVTIAGQASLLLLNRPSRVFPDLTTILVYPSAFMTARKQVDEAGVVSDTPQHLLGESWGDGRVVLSWDHVLHGGQNWTDGQNVVLHEFAHQLDSESGSNNGAPYLGGRTRYQDWSQVLGRDFEHLRADALYRQPSVLDHYGATNPAEFFAVATETFFEKPYQMAERHPELFAQFEQYYRVDPRAWQSAPPEVQPFEHAGHGQWR